MALLEGLAALALLILLQYAIAWLSVRSDRFQSLIKSEPTLVYHRGRFLDAPMRRERLTREELLAAIRSSGTADLDQVGAVVLETDGSISVLEAVKGEGDGAFDTVERPSQGRPVAR